tara:strand:- start:825 stop:1250 length:426 start_codon:yes stop_codon:yes gene_type:complete
MFAVFQSGGKQYRVSPNDILVLDKLDAQSGNNYDFSEILIVGDGQSITTGSPFVKGALVKTTVIEQRKSETTLVFKKKRRHNYRRLRGHRQDQTVVKVIEILGTKKIKASSSEKKVSSSKKDPKAKTNKTTPKSKESSSKE